MKRLSIIFAVLIAIVSSSCKEIEYDENAANYVYVYNGILLYDIIDAANNYAMDGVNVAIRFGVLLDELEKEGFELEEGKTDTFVSDIVDDEEVTKDWDDLPLFNDIYDIRQFLIGYSRYVEISRGEGEQSGVYTITYDASESGYRGGYFDINYRRGIYVIDTNGVPLDQTDGSSTVWTITTNGDLELGGSTDIEPEAICKYYYSRLYHDGDGKILFALSSEYNSGEIGAENGYWSVFDEPGSITFNGYDEDNGLLLDDIINDNIEFTFFGGGETMDGNTVEYETLEPVVFNYTQTIYGAISGSIRASVESTSDYDEAEVQVSFNFTDGYIFNDTYLYNGYTYVNSYYYNVY